MALAEGANEFIVVVQDDDATSSTDFDAQVFLLSIAVDNTISSELIATLDNAADSSSLVVGDFI